MPNVGGFSVSILVNVWCNMLGNVETSGEADDTCRGKVDTDTDRAARSLVDWVLLVNADNMTVLLKHVSCGLVSS